MPYKVFGKNQGGRKAVRGELSRVISQEGSCDSFGGYRLNKALAEVTPLGSGCSDLLAVGGFSHGVSKLGID